MAHYWAALVADHRTPRPAQHVELLHPEADRAGIGAFSHGRLRLNVEVHRLWDVDTDWLASRVGLLRLLPLGRAKGRTARRDLTARAAGAIRAQLGGTEAERALYLDSLARYLYVTPAEVRAFERNRVPIDLSQTTLAVETRRETLREAGRDHIRRFVARRFGDDSRAARAAGIDEALLDGGIDVVASATTADDVVRWLPNHHA